MFDLRWGLKFPLDKWTESSDIGMGPVESITELAGRSSDFFPGAIVIFSSLPTMLYKSYGPENNNLADTAYFLTSVTISFGPRK